jgi:(4S)-4-hydroxy-5-phosphonooxypentane-2,3-dione isomerase
MSDSLEYAVIGIIDAQSGCKVEVEKALYAHRERCLRDEPGTLRLDCLVAQDDENRLVTYELYRNEAAYLEHKAGVSFQQVLVELRSRTKSMSSIRCRVLK